MAARLSRSCHHAVTCRLSVVLIHIFSLQRREPEQLQNKDDYNSYSRLELKSLVTGDTAQQPSGDLDSVRRGQKWAVGGQGDGHYSL